MRLLSILMLCFLFGCSTASTSLNSHNETLKTPTYLGTVNEVQEIAFAAAKRAFPEEDTIYKGDNGKVTIERDWFWRGDTIIEVWVKKLDKKVCIVEAESRPNWHRGNGTLINVSTGELEHYMSTLDLEYKDYCIKQGNYKSTPSSVERLQQLQNAYRDGLITEDEYNYKKKQIMAEI